MTKSTRIYVVADTKGPTRYLVRAINPTSALRRVTHQRFVARVASQDELLRLAHAGVEVIEAPGTAGQEEEEDLFAQEEVGALP